MEKLSLRKINRILYLFFIILTCFPLANAYAWGTGIHIMEGLLILDNLQFISPVIMELLREFPKEYLYGCISADIFIGKGYKKKIDHCHSWAVGKKMLENASFPSEQAFSYGYLSHLASDIIAHNYYIPNQLYLTPSSKRFGHAFWEFGSDSYVSKKCWKVARDIMCYSNDSIDKFLKESVKKKIIPFSAKKMIYSRTIRVQTLIKWQRAVKVISRKSRWGVKEDYIRYLHILAMNLIVDFLNNPESTICFKYDPVGTDNLIMSKKMRKFSKRAMGKKPDSKIFAVPEEITSLSLDPAFHLLLDEAK